MSNQWQKFNAATDIAPNTQAAIPGGNYIGLGRHLVKIDAVEGFVSKNGFPYIRISYSNENGQTLVDTLFPLKKDGNYSYKYKSLSHALSPEDGVLRFEFFLSKDGFLPSNPEVWPGLAGLHLIVNVEKGDKGYTIEDDNGVYRIFDLESKEYVTLMGGIPNEFENYKDARDAAKGQGLKRAWNQVTKFEYSEEHVADNQSVLKSLMGQEPNGSI